MYFLNVNLFFTFEELFKKTIIEWLTCAISNTLLHVNHV